MGTAPLSRAIGTTSARRRGTSAAPQTYGSPMTLSHRPRSPHTGAVARARIASLAGLVTLTSAVLAPPALRAQDAPRAAARVDSLMTSEMARRLIPGAAVVVVRNGVVVRSSTYGLASLELGVPVTSRTLFQVASVTKNMTGVAIMQLVDSGAFALDDRVTTRLDGLPAAWGPVTIRQLLSHTSGLPDMIVDPEKGTWLPGSRDSVLAQLARMPVTPAGTAWAYNQTNYMLLGMLIDKYARRPYVAHIRDRVLAPLGVTGVVFGDSRTVATGRTTEYSRLGIPATASKLTDLRAFHYEYPDALLTAAGIFMHAEDLGRWLVALSRRAGLSRDAFEAMTTVTSLSDGKPFHFPGSTMGYGLGWIVVDAPPRRTFGGSGGGRAALFVYPDEGLAVGVLTNLQGAGPESLVELVAGIYRDSK